MPGRDKQAAIELAFKNRHEAAVHLIALRLDRPLPPRLVVDMAERAAKIAVGEAYIRGEEPVHVDGNVLVFGKAIEIESRAHAYIKIETMRQVEDERLPLSDLEDRSFSTGLRRTE